jgi:hypothetical protein
MVYLLLIHGADIPSFPLPEEDSELCHVQLCFTDSHDLTLRFLFITTREHHANTKVIRSLPSYTNGSLR